MLSLKACLIIASCIAETAWHKVICAAKFRLIEGAGRGGLQEAATAATRAEADRAANIEHSCRRMQVKT